MTKYIKIFFFLIFLSLINILHSAQKPIKAFILAGHSNMGGWGDSTKLPENLRKGNNRVLMFEDDKWQVLKPHALPKKKQKKLNITKFTFGPEITFGHELAKAYPNETIGIIKYAAGGSSILAWKPDWSKEDADRMGQGGRGSLYKNLIDKVKKAQKQKKIEIAGFLWMQGARDMKNVKIANEYLDNLKSLVSSIRKDTGFPKMKFIYSSPRTNGIPDDISSMKKPKNLPRSRPGAWEILQAQSKAQKEISNSKMMIVRDIETYPRNVHYNAAGQIKSGKLFAETYLEK